MVELRRIQKYFPSNGVRALEGADFNLRGGEIHALLGENGAGKSTLMHIMAGFLRPGVEGGGFPRLPGGIFRQEPGSVIVDGRERRFSSPAQALGAGIGMVRQHPRQVPGFPVWENCVLGSTSRPPPLVNLGALRKRVADLNEDLGFGLPLDSPAESLTVSQGQKAVILNLILRDARYLIFDEPTAVLTPLETGRLFEILRRLRDEGKGIVLISHKLEETLKLADRVTVLRRGKTAPPLEAAGLDSASLWELIFGSPSEGEGPGEEPGDGLSTPSPGGGNGFPPALRLRNFAVNTPGRPLIRGLDLDLERGRIMGIAGVRDSGLETLELALTGFLPSLGSLRIGGRELVKRRVRSFRAAGGAYLGTGQEGTALPVRDMLIIHVHRRLQRHGILNRPKIDRWVRLLMSAAQVPLWDKAPAAVFSGGQVQRLLLSRELAEDCVLLVLSEPGRGLDSRYRKELAARLRRKAAGGTAVLIFSTNVEELMALADTVTVLRDGYFTGSFDLNSSGPGDSEETSRGPLSPAAGRIRAAMVGEV